MEPAICVLPVLRLRGDQVVLQCPVVVRRHAAIVVRVGLRMIDRGLELLEQKVVEDPPGCPALDEVASDKEQQCVIPAAQAFVVDSCRGRLRAPCR